MAPSKVKDGNYITIQSFMVKDLKLKGNELLVYAIIYGFSQNEEDKFTGSLQYLCDWTNSTKQGISKVLKSLVEKDFIIKNDVFKNGVKFVEYQAKDFNTIQQSLTGYTTKFNGGMQQSCIGGMQQSLTNNIVLNNIDNNINNNIAKPLTPLGELVDEAEILFNDFWTSYPKQKRVNKKGCFTAFKKIKDLKNETPLILNSLEAYKKSQQWTKNNGQYIPNALTFINQERWKVEQEPTRQDILNNIDMGGWI